MAELTQRDLDDALFQAIDMQKQGIITESEQHAVMQAWKQRGPGTTGSAQGDQVFRGLADRFAATHRTGGGGGMGGGGGFSFGGNGGIDMSSLAVPALLIGGLFMLSRGRR